MSVTPLLPSGALIHGAPAVVLAAVLRDTPALEALLAQLPASVRRQVSVTVAAIEAAADAHRHAVTARVGLPRTATAVADGADGAAPWLTTGQVADLLEVSERRVRQLAAEGRLPGARKLGGRWVVRESEVRGDGSGTGGVSPSAP